MTSPVGGIDPHQDTFTVGIVDGHGIETCHETFATAQLATSTPLICSLITAFGWSVWKGQRSGAHMWRSRSSQPGSTPARSRRRAQLISAARGDWTRPTPSTRSLRRGRCRQSRRSGPPRRWRSMTRWWPRSRPCLSTAVPL